MTIVKERDVEGSTTDIKGGELIKLDDCGVFKWRQFTNIDSNFLN